MSDQRDIDEVTIYIMYQPCHSSEVSFHSSVENIQSPPSCWDIPR